MIREWHEDRPALERSYGEMTVFAIGGALVILLSAVPVAGGLLLFVGSDPAATMLVSACVALALALAFLTVPAHFLCIAANEIRPIILATVVNLSAQLALGLTCGETLGWRWLFPALAGAYLLASVAQFWLAARNIAFPVVPDPTRLRLAIGSLRKAGLWRIGSR